MTSPIRYRANRLHRHPAAATLIASVRVAAVGHLTAELHGVRMIRLRVGMDDLKRMRFAYSPLAEVAESLYLLHSGQIHFVHKGWYDAVRGSLPAVDTPLLRAVVPARGYLANLLLSGAVDADTSLAGQLECVAACPPDQLRADLEVAWAGAELAPAAAELVVMGTDGPRRLADDLWDYWQVAIEPYWRHIRSLLDADVAYRTAQLARGGIQALLTDLHPELHMRERAIEVLGVRSDSEHDLSGAGLLLVPCVFAWPHLIVDPGRTGSPSLTYGPRGVGSLWETGTADEPDDDVLGALLGRGRAAVLLGVRLPRSTTELARALGQSPATVSAHLSILRRCGMVTSWRSGRRVLYQRTALASSVVAATNAGAADTG